MKKENIIIFSVIILIVILVITGYFMFNDNKEVINNNDFKKIYENKENIEVYIKNTQKAENIEITDREDISYILDLLKDEKIKSVKKGEETLGGNYSLRFSLNGEDTVINIFDAQISINEKNYYTENNIKEKIHDIMKKYTINGINN